MALRQKALSTLIMIEVVESDWQISHIEGCGLGRSKPPKIVAKGDPFMETQIQLDREKLAEFCHKWKIRELSIFGSALREDFGPESDLDFLVSFEPGVTLDIVDILDMKEELEKRYGRPVDLIEKGIIRNPWRKREILGTREIIYAAGS
jgi:hypothetical protein